MMVSTSFEKSPLPDPQLRGGNFSVQLEEGSDSRQSHLSSHSERVVASPKDALIRDPNRDSSPKCDGSRFYKWSSSMAYLSQLALEVVVINNQSQAYYEVNKNCDNKMIDKRGHSFEDVFTYIICIYAGIIGPLSSVVINRKYQANLDKIRLSEQHNQDQLPNEISESPKLTSEHRSILRWAAGFFVLNLINPLAVFLYRSTFEDDLKFIKSDEDCWNSVSDYFRDSDAYLEATTALSFFPLGMFVAFTVNQLLTVEEIRRFFDGGVYGVLSDGQEDVARLDAVELSDYLSFNFEDDGGVSSDMDVSGR